MKSTWTSKVKSTKNRHILQQYFLLYVWKNISVCRTWKSLSHAIYIKSWSTKDSAIWVVFFLFSRFTRKFILKEECIGCCSTLPVYIIWPALNTVLRQMKAAEMLVVKIYDFQSKALKNETFSLHFVLYINMVLNMLCLLKTVAAYTLQTDIFCFCREGECFQVALAGLRSRQSISIGLTPAFD